MSSYLASGPYQYDVGDIVQLHPRGHAWTIIWRGRMRGADGWMMPVYRLDNGFWDCYWECDLHSAWGWDQSSFIGWETYVPG